MQPKTKNPTRKRLYQRAEELDGKFNDGQRKAEKLHFTALDKLGNLQELKADIRLEIGLTLGAHGEPLREEFERLDLGRAAQLGEDESLRSVRKFAALLGRIPKGVPGVSQPTIDNVVDDEFTHSDNYESVTMRGKRFLLTKPQARIIKTLDKAQKTGHPDVTLEQLQQVVQFGRLQDVFKQRGDVFKALIHRTDRGWYRLNLPGLN